jgi:hypothetical protein
MKTNTGGPAFPFSPSDVSTSKPQLGMTLRDYFAAKVLHARLTTYKGSWYAGVAEEAYEAADAMLEARKL